MDSAQTASAGVYVYGVAHAASFESDSPFASPGIGGYGEVRTIRDGDLVAVVSNSPRIRYTLRREYLLAHERVLEEVMKRSDVLPVSFGSVAASDRQVQEILLRRRRDDLYAYLEYVRDRVELDLKVHWIQEQLFAEIVAENGAIRSLRQSVSGRHPDRTYFDRIRLGELTEEAIHLKTDQQADSLVEALSPLAIETKVNQELSDMMVLNAAFLVDKPKEEAFDAAVQVLGDAEAGRLTFQYVGPVPPYNFVTIRVWWEE